MTYHQDDSIRRAIDQALDTVAGRSLRGKRQVEKLRQRAYSPPPVTGRRREHLYDPAQPGYALRYMHFCTVDFLQELESKPIKIDIRSITSAINAASKLREKLHHLSKLECGDDNERWMIDNVDHPFERIEAWLREFETRERKFKKLWPNSRKRPLHQWICAMAEGWKRVGVKAGPEEDEFFGQFLIALHERLLGTELTAGVIRNALRSNERRWKSRNKLF